MSVSVHSLPQFVARSEIDSEAWDACIAASSQSLVYAYSWYLDTVLPAPHWKWVGLIVREKAGEYRMVMPVPLRRKMVVGLPYAWVVHQPFFCQFLGIYGCGEGCYPELFYQQLQAKFRYASVLCMRQNPGSQFSFASVRQDATQILDLSGDYSTICNGYSADRKANLHRAMGLNWILAESVDPEPLITLFRHNHAHTIEGGVSDWAYVIFRQLVAELEKRRLLTLRYALCDGRVEAGVLFVQESNRITYLFNAASVKGRKGNARTLLIDQLIRERAGQKLILDFESPEKQAIRDFYQSFGSTEEPYWSVRWNRLNPLERGILSLKNWVNGRT